MIAKDSGTGKSFAGLVNYLENGKAGEKLDRVAWFETANLEVGSMREAAFTMRDAANQNSRVDAPVYHFSINWHADESPRVDQKLAMDITRSAIEDLGLERHQALIVAHKDTDHFHVHVVANRIDPDTNKAWTGSFSKVKLEQAMARLSLEHGFEVVPGHHNSIDLGIEPPAPENSQTTEALRFEERTDTPSFDTTARVELAEVFEAAETWADLQRALEDRGYGLEARGRGLVVTGEEGQYAKASSIGREFSRGQLEQRFGAGFPGPEPEGRDAEASPATSAETQKALGKALGEAESWRAYVDAAESFGFEVQAKGRGLVLVRDGQETKSSAVDRSFGRQRLEERFGQSFKAFEASDERAVARQAFDAAARIETAVSALEDYDRADAYATDMFVQRQEMLVRTEQSHTALQELRDSRKQVERIAGNLYRDPVGALEAFDARRGEVGANRAIRQMMDNPKAFGKTTARGVLGIGDRAFKDAAAQLRAAGERYGRAVSAFSADRERIDADLKERFDKGSNEAWKAARDNVTKIDRGKLAADLLKAVDQVPGGDLARLPFRTPLRRRVVLDRINQVRGEGPAGQGRQAPMPPLNALPSELKGFGAAESYAQARDRVRNAAPWRGAAQKVTAAEFQTLRESAQRLVDQGRGAGRYYSRFGIDRRALDADRFAGTPKAAAERKTAQMSAFMKSKSPKIRIRFTTILRMLGVPVPRIPLPRVPRMPVQSNGKTMIRELGR